MIRNAVTAALCLAAMGLSACSDQGMEANRKICVDFKAAQPGQAGALATPADAAAPLEECVRRWAYSLAPSRDDADTVAEAAVAACGSVLARWNQQSLNQPAAAGQEGGPVEALSIRTGQPTNPLQEHNIFAHDRALFYVVQARAGRCAPPPASKGVPAGIPG